MIDLGSNADANVMDICWAIGETRQIVSNLDRITMGDTELIGRAKSVALLASAYPTFYDRASPGTASAYFTSRTVSGIGTVCGMGYDGVNTLIAVGTLGEISRSINSGSTFAAVASPVAVKLGRPMYFGGRWIIPYDNGTLVSTDGASWTALPAQTGIRAAGKTIAGATHLVHANSTGVYYLANGANSWVKVSTPNPSYEGDLEYGGGHFAYTAGDYAYYSDDDGVTFKKGSLFKIEYPVDAIVSGYVPYIRWVGFGWLRAGQLSGSAALTRANILVFSTSPFGSVSAKSVDRPSSGYAYMERWPPFFDAFAVRRFSSYLLAYRSAADVMEYITNDKGKAEEITFPYRWTAYKSNGATFQESHQNVVNCRVTNAPPEYLLPAINTGMQTGHQFFTRVK